MSSAKMAAILSGGRWVMSSRYGDENNAVKSHYDMTTYNTILYTAQELQ